MRYYDRTEAKALNAERWMLDVLKLNPSYFCVDEVLYDFDEQHIRIRATANTP